MDTIVWAKSKNWLLSFSMWCLGGLELLPEELASVQASRQLAALLGAAAERGATQPLHGLRCSAQSS